MAKKSDILRAFGQKVIAYQPIFTQITGSLTSGVLLSQLYYWYCATGRKFYKIDSEIMQETQLSEKELRNAKARLKQFSFITIKAEGTPAKTYYDFDLDELAELVATIGQNLKRPKGETETAERAKLETPKGRNILIDTENTTENITYTTTHGANEREMPAVLIDNFSPYETHTQQPTAKGANPTKNEMSIFAQPVCENSTFTVHDYHAMWVQAWERAGATLTTLQRQSPDRDTQGSFGKLTAIERDAIREHLPTLFANRSPKYWGQPSRYIIDQVFLKPIVNTTVQAVEKPNTMQIYADQLNDLQRLLAAEQAAKGAANR